MRAREDPIVMYRARERELQGGSGSKKGITFIDFSHSCLDYTCVVTFSYDVASL